MIEKWKCFFGRHKYIYEPNAPVMYILSYVVRMGCLRCRKTWLTSIMGSTRHNDLTDAQAAAWMLGVG